MVTVHEKPHYAVCRYAFVAKQNSVNEFKTEQNIHPFDHVCGVRPNKFLDPE